MYMYAYTVISFINSHTYMYTNTDTKNQTRHMQEMARSFHPERIHFALSFSDWEQALSHGSGLPLDTAQKPCDPSSVLEHIVLTS